MQDNINIHLRQRVIVRIQDSYRMTGFHISGDELFEMCFGRFSTLGTAWINSFRRKLIRGFCRSNGVYPCYIDTESRSSNFLFVISLSLLFSVLKPANNHLCPCLFSFLLLIRVSVPFIKVKGVVTFT
jgi:hypothetical protein